MILILVNGELISLVDLENMFGEILISMKENGKHVLDTGKDLISLQLVIIM